MFIGLTRLGTNYNKRWYIGIVWGVNPNSNLLETEQINHTLYPWYKRYKLWFRTKWSNTL